MNKRSSLTWVYKVLYSDKKAKSNTHLRQNFELAREDGYVFVLIALALSQLLLVLGEAIEEMVDDVRLEDLDAEGVGELLGVALDLHVERQNRCIPGERFSVILETVAAGINIGYELIVE